MTLLSKISIRLFLIILVSVSFITLASVSVSAADEDICKTTADNSEGNCPPIAGKVVFCNITNQQTNEGKCVSCNEGDWACFRMYDNSTTNSYLYWSDLPQLPTIKQALELASGVGSSKEQWSIEKTAQTLVSYAGAGTANLIWPDADTVAQLAAQGINTPPGAINVLASSIGTLSTQRPANTVTYLADLGKQAGIYNPVYAQGTGFSALDPILKVWKAFRNMAYLAFVVIFVVIGFMIMFRSKVSQQAVISIQLALPQIIITLLIITFSYAIAAFMIDLIYLLIYLIIAIFETFGVLGDGGTGATSMLLGKNILGIAVNSQVAGDASQAVGDTIRDLIGKGLVGSSLGWITSVFAYLIFAIAILISLFKLFFQLLMSYIGLIVSTIFAPILLLFNAIPGSQSFQKWLKGIFANAIVFPVTAILLLVSASLAGDDAYGIANDIGYAHNKDIYNKIALPFITGADANGGRGVSAQAFQALVSIGFLMMMPKVVEMVQKALGVEGGLGGMMAGIMEPIQGAYGKTVGPAVGMAQAGAKYGALSKIDTTLSPYKGGPGVKGKVADAFDTWKKWRRP